MKITDFLSEDTIIMNLNANNKRLAIIELLNILKTTKKLEPIEPLVNIILNREKLSSTGIGQGIAIPHGKINTLNKQIGILGISHNGIDFNSLDGELVNIIFLLIGPTNDISQHLKALSKISWLLKEKDTRQAIVKAKTCCDILNIINQRDLII
ncbi:MAG: PTS sugar transporter subunit IIA [Endomicrobium sp.]|jgi:PTS system nitrogen regulatory IIA component|nr:PTS sugar transporter subunit IIA [Endomicrobium sp.]